ncbi:IgGFc-binding protein-like [Xyrichtys novacula]|uniref:IgGFc-binding protein-like n=1 Tax=Xyrichtys novacula TaxID=13765 RepID=A0AAV1FLD7_XYRNO|nr:IgGFc-binding protein-like [Xyrichtys novacula]
MESARLDQIKDALVSHGTLLGQHDSLLKRVTGTLEEMTRQVQQISAQLIEARGPPATAVSAAPASPPAALSPDSVHFKEPFVSHPEPFSAMELRPLTLCLAVALFAVCHSCSSGTEFITTFLTNYQKCKGKNQKLHVVLTALEADADVNIQVASLSFSKTLTVHAGKTKWVSLPKGAELKKQFINSGAAVRISSSAKITAVTFNRRAATGEGAAVSPLEHLGTNHILYVPSDKTIYDGLVAIVNGDSENEITIVPPRDVKLRGMITWNQGEEVRFTMKPFDTYLIKARSCMTGTQITSQKPVAVLTGHQCLKIGGKCDHVYEQLPPVFRMGKEYIIPSVGRPKAKTWGLIVASEDNTVLTLSNGCKEKNRPLQTAGQTLVVVVCHKRPLIVKSNKKVMVLLLSNNKPHDPFLITLTPTFQMSTDWAVETVGGPQKQTLHHSREKGGKKCQGKKQKHVTVQGNALMAVYTYGGKRKLGYGTAGVCGASPPPPLPDDPCEEIQCGARERCVNGACVPTSTATCHAKGDPHYYTLDGRCYNFQGTCTYIMATVANPAPDLIPFTVLTKNAHRGNQRVSFVKTVTVIVYGQTIIISRQKGRVQVNGVMRCLPFNLLGGKIKLRQAGCYAVLTTDFGLIVKFDWNMRLIITVPSSYFEHMGGLCGNYNGDRKDDLPHPTSKSLPVVLEMIKHWKVDDPDLFCNDNCGGSCPECSIELQNHYRKLHLCGLISKPDGPFAACHSAVHLSAFVNDCVYDLCVYGGAKPVLCDNLKTYADSCLSEGVQLSAEWREVSGCIPDCPAGSHYEACGTACPAYCSTLDSETECNEPCVEGCQCDEGYVLSGEKCVPKSQCGCDYQDNYYPSGTTFWEDETCTSRCKCENGTVEVSMSESICANDEHCALREGIRDCYPASFGLCKCTGDPHCTGLDGRRFHFQGTCTYILSQLVMGPQQLLEPFQIQVTNENRGRNKRVSWTKSVFLTVFGGFTIGMSNTNNGKIMVNGRLTNLPYNTEDGNVRAFRKGRFGVVKTSFGLMVKFDWRANVQMSLPSTYTGQTNGLCGNFDGNTENDFLKPDGTLADNVNEFGGSWQVGGEAGCTNNPDPVCEPALMLVYEKKPYCGIISDKEGPFGQCHEKLDHRPFLDDCKFDMCAFKGLRFTLCESLTAFADACQVKGGKVESWRKNDFCPMPCPANSHYELSAPACQPTCSSLAPPEGCEEDSPMVESCVCDENFLLSTDKCVLVEECGCWKEGVYYENGESFIRGESCDEQCTCSEGQLTCNPFACSEHEKCVQKDGVPSCEPKSIATCSLTGVRTVKTFDGQNYPLFGNCPFTMSEVEEMDEGMPAYSVLVLQTDEAGAVSRDVEITVYDTKITFETGVQWKVKIDDVAVVLPWSLDNDKVLITQHCNFIVLETDFGLKVTYDTKGGVVLQIPSTYHNAPRGLCGNNNNDPSDDLKNGDPLETANLWLVSIDDVQCEASCGAATCPGPDDGNVPNAETDCGIIKSPEGPFVECHTTVEPSPYFDACVSELATHNLDQQILCKHISIYVAACQLAGVALEPWRRPDFCPPTCSSGSHYELCASSSSSTCASLEEPFPSTVCQEGCQCDDELLSDGNQCVPMENCGCLVNGNYYQSGTSVLNEDCSESCTCEAGVFTCIDHSCQEEEECLIKEGIIGCYPIVPDCPAGSHYEACGTACPAYCSTLDSETECNEPCVEGCQCDEGYVLSGEKCVPKSQCGCDYQDNYYPSGTTFWEDETCTSRCKCENGTVEVSMSESICKKNEHCALREGIRDCYPASFGLCKCTGDPHCTGLDGRRFHFQGTCTYILSQLVMGPQEHLEPFQIQVTNENRGRNKRVSWTKSVFLTVFGGFTIGMSNTNNGKIMVNGRLTNLPYNTEDGNVRAFRKGRFGVVKTSFGLMVQFDWRANVQMSLPSTYTGQTNGLCGNFDGNTENDFLKPDGTLADNVNEFGGSWQVGGDAGCTNNPGPVCEPALMSVYEKKPYCGIISDPEGPFAQCHDKLDHIPFFEDCKYDMCAFKGHLSTLCASLTAFVEACQEAGATVQSWRREDFCPMTCPANSHYVLSAPACQPTCSGLTIPEGCEEDSPGVEGCVCDEDFILSTDKCVPMEECGCQEGGVYYENGQCFFRGESCDVRCTCSEGQIQCNPSFACSEHEKCVLKDGVPSCEPKSIATCSVAGVRTVETFDGQNYPLFGNCLFTLSEVEETDEGMPAYSVLVLQTDEAGAVSRDVEITVYDTEITFETGVQWKVKIDDITVVLPWSLDNDKVLITQHGDYIVLETDFGLKVAYDTKGGVVLQIPSTYHNAPHGLCGNNNNDPSDDMENDDPLETAKHWLVPMDDVQCEASCGAATCPGPDDDEIPDAQTACGIIKSPEGPFVECHTTVKPAQYFNACVRELATYKKDEQLLCKHIRIYVAACQLAGVELKPWRSPSFCPPTCPSESHYELCASSSSSTCASLEEPFPSTVCQEGCQCNGELLFDGPQCVPVEDCGCLVNGHYYQSGTSVLAEDCSEICSCEAGIFSCKDHSCQPEEECRNENGVTVCILEAPICPPGSHYEACGTACPAYCSTLDSETECNEPCVEGCQCDEGHVLSGERCVPKSQCGCDYQGNYYPSGTTFWKDETCTSRCKCENGKVECETTSCKKNEHCALREGIRDCYPASFGLCKCTGDPHCKGLDGRRFHFQGPCTYILSQLVMGPQEHLEPFQIQVTNENRGRNKRVSWTKSVFLTVFGGFTIGMSNTNNGKIMVNGMLTNLPYTTEDGNVRAFRKGRFGVVKTSFGLEVKFDWRANVQMRLPSTYAGQTNGLCGDFDGNPKNDFLKSDGTQADNVNDFGGSWQVGGDAGCTNIPPFECEPALMSEYEKQSYCGIISDPEGPFAQCHDKLDHIPFFEDCIFDVCAVRGRLSTLCASLTAFVEACQEAGATVESWRRDDFCPMTCPANSHYELSAPACEPTCGSLTIPEGCEEDSPGVEGCVCDEDFILSTDKCVRVEECGCQEGGEYYENGQCFFRGESCDVRCTCSKGQIECNPSFACSEHEKCVLKDGVISCEPKSIATCSVAGVRMVETFDGKNYPLFGKCPFTMSEVDEGMPAYSVLVLQTDEAGAVSRDVEITVYGKEITFEKGVQWKVKIDDNAVVLPWSLNNDKVLITQHGDYIVLETDFGLKVAYDTKGGVVLQIPSTYHNAPHGLCGNNNNDPSDDMENDDPLETANLWLVPMDNVPCEASCGAATCPGPDDDEIPDAQTACGIIKSPEGPFVECHNTIEPSQYFDACVWELATYEEDEQLLCKHIWIYVAACQLAGVELKPWRNSGFCPPICPSGSHYELCASSSSSTCASLEEPFPSMVCQEGCQCDDEQLFDGPHCVPVEDCGCFVYGTYYKLGTSVLNEDCSVSCSCEAGGEISCTDHSCQLKEECRIEEGIIGCYPIDPCKDIKCRVKEHCEVIEGEGVCVADFNTTCWAFGDPHIQRLDGGRFSFQGTCSYIFLTTTDLDPTLPKVTVTMKNELRGNSQGSYVRSVTVKILGHHIEIPSGQGDIILVDDNIEELPYYSEDGRLSITQSGIRGIIETDFGVEITFDWSTLLMVTLSSSYFGNTGGLCGNYNGNSTDDMTTPDGVLLTDVVAWAESWSVPDGDIFCYHQCEGDCPQCSQEDQKKYSGPKFCGFLSNPNGPFAVCHAKVPVEDLQSDCLYDVCLNDGRQEVLCGAFSSYMADCQKLGVNVGPWRELAGCPLECPDNSHYSPCGPACPATCGPQPEVCPAVCVEGCFCDDGYVQSGEECVIREKGCGCEFKGHYHKPGEEFWANVECTEKCVCDPATQNVTCEPAGCQAGEVCRIENGVLDCYPIRFETCVTRGDPHHYGYDGRRVDFQGNCVYRLSGLCGPNPTGLKPFEITLENENRNGNKRVSYAKAVTLKVFGKEFTLTRDNPGKVLVDGLEESLPMSWENSLVQGQLQHRHAVIETHFLKVSFDFFSTVKVHLASSYNNAVCGLCGNMNGDPSDDMMLPNGEQAATANEFGVSQWVADVEGCSKECKDCPPDIPPGTKPPAYTKDCDIITAEDGPLAGCINLLKAEQYHEDCVYDMMLTDGSRDAACAIIRDYVEECLSKGGEVKPWRTKKFCPMKCPAGSEYSLKAPGCPITCRSLSPPARCKIPPSEGCVCKKGKLMGKKGCVKLAKCGCTVKGQYFEPHEGHYINNKCKTFCKCHKGAMVCKYKPCKATEKCMVLKGVRGCYKEGDSNSNSSGGQSGESNSNSSGGQSGNSDSNQSGGQSGNSDSNESGGQSGNSDSNQSGGQSGGCTMEGQYYEPNEGHYLNNTCKTFCKCYKGAMVCEYKPCKATEKCMVVKGVRGCYKEGDSNSNQSGGQSGNSDSNQSGGKSGNSDSNESGGQSGNSTSNSSGGQSGKSDSNQSGGQSGNSDSNQSGGQSGNSDSNQSGGKSGNSDSNESGGKSGNSTSNSSGGQSGKSDSNQSGGKSGNSDSNQSGGTIW